MTGHPWPKNCGCGAVWSREAWSKLPYLARWDIEGGPTHELRHCLCHTTLAVDVGALDGAAEGAEAGDRQASGDDRLAHLLAERKNELYLRWTQRLRADLADGTPRLEPALCRVIPLFIDELIARLLGDGPDSRRLRAITAERPARVRDVARRTMRATLREWAEFRAALIDLCDHAQVVLDASRARLVHRAIDDAASRSASDIHESPGG